MCCRAIKAKLIVVTEIAYQCPYSEILSNAGEEFEFDQEIQINFNEFKYPGQISALPSGGKSKDAVVHFFIE